MNAGFSDDEFADEEFADNEFADEEFADNEFADDTNTDRSVDGNIIADTQDDISDEFNEADSFINDTDEDESDETIYNELKVEATNLGYTVTDDLTEHDLQYLVKRIKNVRDDKQEVLTEFVYQQAKVTIANKEKLATSCATMLMSNKDDEYARISSVVSADAKLGVETSRIVRNWVEMGILNKFDITDDELFQSFMLEGNLSSAVALTKEPYIRRYIQSLRPVYLAMYEKVIEHDSRYETSRKRLATEFIKESVINDQKILKAKNRKLIRQIHQCDDESYETICPVCGKSVKLGKYAMYAIAFMTEKGVQKTAGATYNVCSTEGCDTALMLSIDEYNKIRKGYFTKCSDAINAFLTVAKKECPGAAVMFTRISFDTVQVEVPEIFTGTGRVFSNFTMEMDDKEADTTRVFVDDDEMLAAVKKFYFKLPGIAECLARNEQSYVAENANTEMGATINMHGRSASMCRQQLGWTPHEVAVLIAQCLSKDYTLEYNRALFSLALSIQANPFLADALSISKITSMENALTLISQYTNNGKIKPLSKNETVNLLTALTFAGKEVKDRDVIELAVNSVNDLKDALKNAKILRNKTIADLKRFEDELAFTKIVKVGSCKLSDLAILLQTEDLIDLTDRIVNRMIISNYAGMFCDYWLTLGVVKPRLIESVCNTNSNMNSVYGKLKDFVRDGLISEQASKDMWPIYKRSVELSQVLRKLHRDYMTADFVGFCNDLKNIPDSQLGSGKIDKALLEALQDLAAKSYKYAGKPKSVVYLSNFYSEEEINGCMKCNDLLFGRYVLVPLANETIDDYCERCLDWDDRLSPNLAVYDLFNKFDEIGANKYSVLFSICSAMYDAEYESFGKSIFMNAILTDICRRVDSIKYAEGMLQVSVMQYHIIQTVPQHKVPYGDIVAVDRVLHAYSVTSLEQFIEKYQAIYDIQDVKVDSIFDNIEYLLDSKKLYHKLLEELPTYRTEDGEPIADETEIIDEFKMYTGIEVEGD